MLTVMMKWFELSLSVTISFLYWHSKATDAFPHVFCWDTTAHTAHSTHHRQRSFQANPKMDTCDLWSVYRQSQKKTITAVILLWCGYRIQVHHVPFISCCKNEKWLTVSIWFLTYTAVVTEIKTYWLPRKQNLIWIIWTKWLVITSYMIFTNID